MSLSGKKRKNLTPHLEVQRHRLGPAFFDGCCRVLPPGPFSELENSSDQIQCPSACKFCSGTVDTGRCQW